MTWASAKSAVMSILTERFPVKSFEEALEDFKNFSSAHAEAVKNSPGKYDEHVRSQLIARTATLNNTALSVNVSSALTMGFQIKAVESCCAMKFLYSFSVDAKTPEAEKAVDEILNIYFKEMGPMLTSRRLIINMVEQRGTRHMDPFEVVEAVADPKIVFKPLWNYFHKYHKVNTMLMPNKNTGNIIHHMEVLFDPKFFN